MNEYADSGNTGGLLVGVYVESSLLCSSVRSTSCKTGGRSEPAKQSLKKPKLPVGRFDEPEESSIEREPLERFLLLPFLIFNRAPHYLSGSPGLRIPRWNQSCYKREGWT
ncbi:succinate dehydrogenase assembly factor 4, mitochondrial [Calonectris borealis]|uniref:succinate dehydrogenase assembly factor 4, mitochondrial n=1 Tax=Calonectris borealis TaxID=1323832 RepID=UPI003F4C6CF9